MKWFIHNMFGYWIFLLVISCGLSAICYEVFLKHLMK
jgi:hypothetical protein